MSILLDKFLVGVMPRDARVNILKYLDEASIIMLTLAYMKESSRQSIHFCKYTCICPRLVRNLGCIHMHGGLCRQCINARADDVRAPCTSWVQDIFEHIFDIYHCSNKDICVWFRIVWCCAAYGYGDLLDWLIAMYQPQHLLHGAGYGMIFWAQLVRSNRIDMMNRFVNVMDCPYSLTIDGDALLDWAPCQADVNLETIIAARSMGFDWSDEFIYNATMIGREDLVAYGIRNRSYCYCGQETPIEFSTCPDHEHNDFANKGSLSLSRTVLYATQYCHLNIFDLLHDRNIWTYMEPENLHSVLERSVHFWACFDIPNSRIFEILKLYASRITLSARILGKLLGIACGYRRGEGIKGARTSLSAPPHLDMIGYIMRRTTLDDLRPLFKNNALIAVTKEALQLAVMLLNMPVTIDILWNAIRLRDDEFAIYVVTLNPSLIHEVCVDNIDGVIGDRLRLFRTSHPHDGGESASKKLCTCSHRFA